MEKEKIKIREILNGQIDWDKFTDQMPHKAIQIEEAFYIFAERLIDMAAENATIYGETFHTNEPLLSLSTKDTLIVRNDDMADEIWRIDKSSIYDTKAQIEL